jgi:two-component system KDP operon response regulator KdpE
VVLLVDDDPDILRVLGMCLSAENCDVREAPSGADALCTLDGVDVLVVDQRMPNMCGTDVIASARAKGYAGRALVISSSRSARSEADVARADGFLAKPIGPRELIAEVERLFYLNVPACRSSERSPRTSVVPSKA